MKTVVKKKKRKKRHYASISQRRHTSAYRKKKGTPGWIKALIPIVFIIIIGTIAVWQFSPNEPTVQPPTQPSNEPPQEQYPTSATGVFINPTVTENGNSVQLPHASLKENKIVFADLPLSGTVSQLEYQDRIIPLNLYKSGEYLPIIGIYTPSGKVKVGIRTCEPCGGFSMHIGDGKHLVCDICGTKWDLETFNGVSGGCPEYPPPQLPVTINDNLVEIDLSTIGTTIKT